MIIMEKIMKLKTLAKTLPLVVTAALCSNANAGVSASAYLEVNDLFIEIDINGDGTADAITLSDYVTILGGSRGTSTAVDYNGVVDGDADIVGVTAASDADLVCVPVTCASLGVVNNGQSLALANLLADDTSSYAVADAGLSGSAIGAGASGFTYADVGIASADAIAAGNGTIFNSILTELTLDILSDVNIRFTANYDAFIDSVISPDIQADGDFVATASAEASFGVKVTSSLGPTVLEEGFNFQDQAFDFLGFPDIVITENVTPWASSWTTVTAGTYALEIAQDADVLASLAHVPEPATLAIFGLGLLGLAGVGRMRKTTS
jgi:hypothetical protein